MASTFFVAKVLILLFICSTSLGGRPKDEIHKDAKKLAYQLAYKVTLARNAPFRNDVYKKLAAWINKKNGNALDENKLVAEWEAWKYNEKKRDSGVETSKLTRRYQYIIDDLTFALDRHDSLNTLAVGYDENCKEIIIAGNFVTSVLRQDFNFVSDPVTEFNNMAKAPEYKDGGLRQADIDIMHTILVQNNKTAGEVKTSDYQIKFITLNIPKVKDEINKNFLNKYHLERLAARLYHAEIQIYHYWEPDYPNFTADDFLVIEASKPKCQSCTDFLFQKRYVFDPAERAGSAPGRDDPIIEPVRGTKAEDDTVFLLTKKEIEAIFQRENYYTKPETDIEYPVDATYAKLMAALPACTPPKPEEDIGNTTKPLCDAEGTGTCRKRKATSPPPL